MLDLATIAAWQRCSIHGRSSWPPWPDGSRANHKAATAGASTGMAPRNSSPPCGWRQVPACGELHRGPEASARYQPAPRCLNVFSRIDFVPRIGQLCPDSELSGQSADFERRETRRSPLSCPCLCRNHIILDRLTRWRSTTGSHRHQRLLGFPFIVGWLMLPARPRPVEHGIDFEVPDRCCLFGGGKSITFFCHFVFKGFPVEGVVFSY